MGLARDKIDGSILVRASNPSEVDAALKKYGLDEQDGAVFDAISDADGYEGRNIIIVREFDEYLKAAEKYLDGFEKS